MAFTIAAIILISGIFVRLSAANSSSGIEEDYYPFYRDMQTVSFGVAPMSTEVKSFEGQVGQKISLRLNVAESEVIAGSSSLLRIAVNVTDSTGKQLVYDDNVGRTYSIEPINVENNGTVSVGISNLEDEPVQITMYLRQSAPPPTAGILDKAVETFSNWLMIISAPIFGLGIWLLIPRKEKANQPA